MNIEFDKYHALGNDFIVFEASKLKIPARRRTQLAQRVCDRQMGVGADGIVILSGSRKADRKFEIYNADGGSAEMSGNGLRIAGLHLLRKFTRRREFSFESGDSIHAVRVGDKRLTGRVLSCDLGRPEFATSKIGVKSKRRHIINQPMKFGPSALPVTCVATGNPHVVLIVDNFEFDWPELGAEIETADLFLRGTNVEFARVCSRSKLEVKVWERGVGQTASSGTGAAAAVCTTIMLGMTNRRCRVQFETGQVEIFWSGENQNIELSGVVTFIASGEIEFTP